MFLFPAWLIKLYSYGYYRTHKQVISILLDPVAVLSPGSSFILKKFLVEIDIRIRIYLDVVLMGV